MNTTDAPTINADDLNYWSALVKQTRRFGHCYVHAAARYSAFASRACNAEHNGRAVAISWTSWGRSLQGGGHKYKVHARYADTGRPVPSKTLGFLKRI